MRRPALILALAMAAVACHRAAAPDATPSPSRLPLPATSAASPAPTSRTWIATSSTGAATTAATSAVVSTSARAARTAAEDVPPEIVSLRWAWGCRGDRERATLFPQATLPAAPPPDACVTDVDEDLGCTPDRPAALAKKKRLEELRKTFPQGPLVRVEIAAPAGLAVEPSAGVFAWSLGYQVRQGACGGEVVRSAGAGPEPQTLPYHPFCAGLVHVGSKIPLPPAGATSARWIDVGALSGGSGDALVGATIGDDAESVCHSVEDALTQPDGAAPYTVQVGEQTETLGRAAEWVIEQDAPWPTVRGSLPQKWCPEKCQE